ncbi:MAG: RNA polymerase subunit sigma-70, partial [Oscillospiraceae bacterium]|nr:RNA polymerase subunit sigma-70 [Oscillospiraceae bacterium]
MPAATDAQIISLFHERDQKALSETQQKYGGLCRSIAKYILGSREDAEECLNDALLRLWESI